MYYLKTIIQRFVETSRATHKKFPASFNVNLLQRCFLLFHNPRPSQHSFRITVTVYLTWLARRYHRLTNDAATSNVKFSGRTDRSGHTNQDPSLTLTRLPERLGVNYNLPQQPSRVHQTSVVK